MLFKNIKNIQKKDSLDINVVKNNDDKNIDLTSFWKDLVRALRRTNTVD